MVEASEAWPRRVVGAFAQEMEAKLQANDHKGGWEGMNPRKLLELLHEEVEELKLAVGRNAWERDVVRECADVANFAMMIADVYTPEYDK